MQHSNLNKAAFVTEPQRLLVHKLKRPLFLCFSFISLTRPSALGCDTSMLRPTLVIFQICDSTTPPTPASPRLHDQPVLGRGVFLQQLNSNLNLQPGLFLV